MLAFVRLAVLALVASFGTASGALAHLEKPALRALDTSGLIASASSAPNAAECVGKLGLHVRLARQDQRLGQYEDAETGLYYNRFRYYDAEAGQYASQDPIGLRGGIRAYNYVRDPLTWVDELGLKACASRRDAFRSAKRDAGIPIGQHPQVFHAPMTDRAGRSVLNERGQPIVTREYHFKRQDGMDVVIQEQSAGHRFPDGGVEGPHFNVRPAAT